MGKKQDLALMDKMLAGLIECRRFIADNADKPWPWLDQLVNESEWRLARTERVAVLLDAFKDAPFVQAQGCMSGCRSPNSDIAFFRPVVDKPLDVTRNGGIIEPSTQHTGETK